MRFTLKRYRDGVTVEVSLSTHKRPAAWHTYAGSMTTPDGVRHWLNNHKHRDEETSANIGQAKTAPQVARDIIRRVLPITEELAKRALASHALELERKAWLELTAAQIMGATRERLSLRLSHHDEKSTRRELRHWSKPYVTVTLDAYDHEVKVEVEDIPPETALAMLAKLPAASANGSSPERFATCTTTQRAAAGAVATSAERPFDQNPRRPPVCLTPHSALER